MRMIKAMGCNFVRLVHYPHDRRIVELADEIGLIVSEEPGFWNMITDEPGQRCAVALPVMLAQSACAGFVEPQMRLHDEQSTGHPGAGPG